MNLFKNKLSNTNKLLLFIILITIHINSKSLIAQVIYNTPLDTSAKTNITPNNQLSNPHLDHNHSDHNHSDHNHSDPQFTPNAVMPPNFKTQNFNPQQFKNLIPENNFIYDSNQKLQGMWVKESFIIQNDKGGWEDFDWHKGGKMYLIYDGLGGMALHSTSKDYFDFFSFNSNSQSIKKGKLNSKDNSKDNSKYNTKEIYKENYVYFGRYELKADTIIHSKISHTIIDEIGTKSFRKFYFEKDKNGNENLILIPLEFKKPAKIVFKRYK